MFLAEFSCGLYFRRLKTVMYHVSLLIDFICVRFTVSPLFFHCSINDYQ